VSSTRRNCSEISEWLPGHVWGRPLIGKTARIAA
jgi:hypothetical protein